LAVTVAWLRVCHFAAAMSPARLRLRQISLTFEHVAQLIPSDDRKQVNVAVIDC
jgi:hypothetical protein